MALGIAEEIGKIRDFESLLKYLQKDLDWPIDLAEVDELTFEYQPEELGLDEDCRVEIREIKHLRPLTTNQPWGVFWIEFENRHLPVVVMRRILRALVPKKRASARAADRAVWNCKDLLFISSLGEHGHRRITFSHFREEKDAEPTLETFSWDERETHFYYLERLHMDRLQWPADTTDLDRWRRQWSSAFTAGYREPIRTAKDLSESLATLAARTRDLVLDVLKYERADGPLHRLYESFQKVLIHDLEEAGFADMVAQTVAYGLFSARCTGQEVLGLAHLEAMVPNTNRFLKELFAELASISGHKKDQINFDDLGLSEMVDLLKNTNIEAVLEDFGRQSGGGREDPVVHFYETFLSVYDKQQKVQRGVFYTPKPVVSFIVRSVHEILQKEFGLTDGLAAITTWGEMVERANDLKLPQGVKNETPFVQILDPATGTGTFLEEVIDVVHKTMMAKWRKQGQTAARCLESWNEYVPKHLLPRLHGLELMMAPYSVAHMKLGLKLRQTGYDFKSNQQLRLYLSNTLEPPEKGTRKLGFLPDFLSHESVQADLIKERKIITVIVGNPPYSNFGQLNRNDWILAALNTYKEGLAEKKLNLDDDFIKFIRFSHWKLTGSPLGVLGFITNNTYFDGITHRRMRASLLDSFPQVGILNLHGSIKKNEACPDGSTDENVFDIQQGVGISLLVRSPRSDSCVKYADCWGLREAKYKTLQDTTFSSLAATALSPRAELFLFVPRDATYQSEYEAWPRVTEVFGLFNSGIQTKKDSLSIHFSKSSLREVLATVRAEGPEKLRTLYELGPDGRDWSVAAARADVKNSKGLEISLQYRPFDLRWTYFTGHSRGFLAYPRADVTSQFLSDNIAFVSVRQVAGVPDQCEVFVSRCNVTDRAMYSTHGTPYVFPVYRYFTGREGLYRDYQFDGTTEKLPKLVAVANLSQGFVDLARRRLGIDLTSIPEGPRQALHYLYAVVHSKEYRNRYAGLLRSDFPRLPVTSDVKLFLSLCQCGADLVAVHLLEEDYAAASWNLSTSKRPNPFQRFSYALAGDRNASVSKGYPKFESKRVYINPSSWFESISEEQWLFRVGGYQVLERWLKERQGRSLDQRDIQHFSRMCVAAKATPGLSEEIESIIERNGGWPLRGSGGE